MNSNIEILKIYGDNFDSKKIERMSSVKGDKFHFLIRRVGNVEFKDDFEISEEEVFKN